MKHPGKALNIGEKIGCATASRNPKATFFTLPDVINFHHTIEGSTLEKFVLGNEHYKVVSSCITLTIQKIIESSIVNRPKVMDLNGSSVWDCFQIYRRIIWIL